jgi:hypothetical protein
MPARRSTTRPLRRAAGSLARVAVVIVAAGAAWFALLAGAVSISFLDGDLHPNEYRASGYLSIGAAVVLVVLVAGSLGAGLRRSWRLVVASTAAMGAAAALALGFAGPLAASGECLSITDEPGASACDIGEQREPEHAAVTIGGAALVLVAGAALVGELRGGP